MSKKLFEHLQEGHDPIGRIVFLCKDKHGTYVYKPTSGFKSKHYGADDEEAQQACFNRQQSCGHVHAFYEDWERQADGEVYPSFEATVKKPTKKQLQAAEKEAADKLIADELAAEKLAADALAGDKVAIEALQAAEQAKA
ncbi:MAG: hypothetical protein H7320_13080 [Ferruginibacter sp.]|nr:hypothetical protein [Ferruginibacter sp.]